MPSRWPACAPLERCAWVPSTWMSMPTASPLRTRITARRIIRTIPAGLPADRPADRQQQLLPGEDPADPVQVHRSREPVSAILDEGIDGLRIARLVGYFARGGLDCAQQATGAVARGLTASAEVELPDAAAARSAAFLITAAE